MLDLNKLQKIVSYNKELNYFKDNFNFFYSAILESKIKFSSYKELRPFQILYKQDSSWDKFFYLGQNKTRLYFVNYSEFNKDISPLFCFSVPANNFNNKRLSLTGLHFLYTSLNKDLLKLDKILTLTENFLKVNYEY